MCELKVKQGQLRLYISNIFGQFLTSSYHVHRRPVMYEYSTIKHNTILNNTEVYSLGVIAICLWLPTAV